MPETTGTRNVARYLPLMARERAEQTAIVSVARRERSGRLHYVRWTYAELDRESDAYAHGLLAAGICRGTRVLLMVRAGLPLIGLTFALFKLGAVPIVIDPAMGRRNLLQCITECAPQALIGVPRAHLARLLFPAPFRTLQTAVTVGPRLGWGGPTLAALRQQGLGRGAFPPADAPADELAAILFTTGSTGVPKGVEYTHGIFDAQVQLIRDVYHITAGEIEMPAFPLFSLFNVALGLTSAIPPLDPTRPAQCDPRGIVRMIHDLQVTSSFGSPAIWRRVAAYCLSARLTLPSLRRVLMAGAPVPLEVHRQLHQLMPADGDSHTPYGATEALPIVSAPGRAILAAHAEHPGPLGGTCVGWPLPGTTVRIIAIDDAAIAVWHDALALPPEHVGEIVVRGPTVTARYHQRPAATRLAKIADGDAVWHRMGDIGRLDAAGRLWFYGRKSHRVILPDQTLFTEPVELVFNSHPAVRRTALVGVAHGDGIRPVVCVELPDGRIPGRADAARLIDGLRTLGAAYAPTAQIDTFLFHRGFPVDIRHNAKIFREQLARWASARLARQRGP
ncbi:MAG: AMP-binding protein [Chloroflexi bacterium]|nr:AMP-binding protein [Chloroflexota bacterium]